MLSTNAETDYENTLLVYINYQSRLGSAVRFYRNAGRRSFQQNPLHSHIQSAIDGKLKRLETFRNKLADAKRRSFHFE